MIERLALFGQRFAASGGAHPIFVPRRRDLPS
jgi:hypothetical protein